MIGDCHALILTSVLWMQSQHDYMLGNYPVGRDDAAQLAALQLLAEIGSVPNPETCMYALAFCGFGKFLD